MKVALKRLDRLTNEEARMASAQVLKSTHVIDVKLTGVDDKVEGVDTQVKNVRGEVQRVNNNVHDVKRNQLWESLRKWRFPPDPSINHNTACDRQLEGTAERVASSRNGRLLVPCCGSTTNRALERPSYALPSLKTF